MVHVPGDCVEQAFHGTCDCVEPWGCALVQVPLVIFKREKEIARQLEFEGLYIVDQPSDDDVRAHWDKLVLSTVSFPQSYWDKFVKKKVVWLLLGGWVKGCVGSC